MKKRILSILLAAVMIFAILPMGAMAAESNKCGDSLTWSVKNNVLTISGTGDMWDYEWNTQPWPHTITSIVIKSGVTSIGDYAFYFFSDVTSVTIPDTVKSIGVAAFYNCFRLTSVTIPGSVKSIGDSAFACCYSLTSLKLGKGVTEIGNGAFAECSDLKSITIPNSVTSIGNGAFAECSDLKSITIPDSVKSIGHRAFKGCRGLADEMGFVIFRNVLYDYCSNGAVVDEIVTVPGTVTEISDSAFNSSVNMTGIRIPVSVKKICDYAFDGCSGLKDVFYGGSKSQWNSVKIGADNDKLLNAAKHYNSYTLGISTQPKSVTVAANSNVMFSVRAFGSGLTYQWQYKTPGGTKWNTSTSTGAKTEWLTIKATSARNGQQYRCIVTDSEGNKVTSNAATIKIVSIEITTQPMSCSRTVDSDALFRVAASGVELKYQWQYSANGGKTWSKSSQHDATTNRLTVDVRSYRDGYMYRCVITDSEGNKVISDAATLTVNPLKITTQPVSCTAPVNAKAVFSVKVAGSGYKYQWQYSANGGETWSNSSQADAATDTLTVAVKSYRDGYRYRCIISDAYGNKVYSNAATLSITPISTQPQSITTTAGKTVTFSVEVTDSSLGYWWQYKKAGGTTWYYSTSDGAKTANLSVKATQDRNGQQYRCTIWDDYGNVYTSDAATLTVKK